MASRNPEKSIEDRSERELMIEILTRIEDVAKNVAHLDHIVTGNGDPTNGHIVRIDRLEQDAGRQRWWTRSIATALIASVGAWVWDLVTKKGP